MTTASGQPSNLPTDRYWCSVPTEGLPEVVRAQCRRFWDRLESTGTLDLWRRSDRAYYGLDESGAWKASAAVTFSGDQRELVMARVNHYRSIAQAMIAMATAERPTLQAKSLNDETESLMEAPNATGLVEAFRRTKQMETLRQRDVERAVVYGEGYQHLRWSPHAGKPIPWQPPQPNPEAGYRDAEPSMMPEPPEDGLARDEYGAILHEGDVVPASCSPISVVHDLDSQSNVLQWALVAHREDAWELAARYPQFAEDLRNAVGQPRWPERVWAQSMESDTPAPGDSRITVWCLYHVATDAMPQGRYAVIAANRVLYDGPALMDEVPVYALIPTLHLDTGEGHSVMWDLLGLQELYDAAVSSTSTGHDAYGIQNYLIPRGSGVTPDDISGGLKGIEYDPVSVGTGAPAKPEQLAWSPVPAQAYEWQDVIEKMMEKISGVNSTVRGTPDSTVKSGSFAALMTSNATHFNGALQRAVVLHDERWATGYVKILKSAGGNVPRVAEIEGRRGSRLKKVMPGEVESIDRVVVEQINPAMAQPGARMELIEKLIDKGVIQTPQEIIRVINSGRIEPVLDGPEAELDVISGENDLLEDGKLPAVCYFEQPKPAALGGPVAAPGMPPPQPVGRTCHPSDDHALHVREHKALLTLEARRNPAILKAIEKHLADHTAVAADLPPVVAMLTGQTVTIPQMGPGAPPGPDGAPGGPPGGPKGQDAPGGSGGPPKAKPMGAEGGPGMPDMPQNPVTGQRAPAA